MTVVVSPLQPPPTYASYYTLKLKALVIYGKRSVLQSGSIHYPRAASKVWPDIIQKAKEGGLDVIETYVFWNYHEPVKGENRPYGEDEYESRGAPAVLLSIDESR